jgi:hypothetical protein
LGVGLPSSKLFNTWGFTYEIVDLISVPGKVFIDQVEGVPSEEYCLVKHFSFTISSKGLVHQLINFKFYYWFKTFLLHPLSTIASKADLVTRDGLKLSHNFRAGEVSLPAVCKDADCLLLLAE